MLSIGITSATKQTPHICLLPITFTMINSANFDALANVSGTYLVSIYLATDGVGNEKHHQLAFKNALRRVQAVLTNTHGLTTNEAADYLAKAERLAEDSTFWTQQSEGLAVFISPSRTTHCKLPMIITTDEVVDERFYLSPLIPCLDDHREFYLLTLSRGMHRLFLVDRDRARQIDTTGLVPQDMQDALLLDAPSAQLQRVGGAFTRRGSVHVGNGPEKDAATERLKQYMDTIDSGIKILLKNDTRPLLLAGVDELIPVYRAANGYQELLEKIHVSGNVDNCTPAELHERAWLAVGDRFDKQRDRDYEIYGVNSALGETSDDVRTLVPAALNGRVSVLWVKADTKIYGEYLPKTNGIKITNPEKGTELYDLAAVAARQNGARVYVVPPNDLPSGDSDICGILRYSVQSKITNLRQTSN